MGSVRKLGKDKEGIEELKRYLADKSADHLLLYNLEMEVENTEFFIYEGDGVEGVLCDWRGDPRHKHYFHLRGSGPIAEILLEKAEDISGKVNRVYMLPDELSTIAEDIIGTGAPTSIFRVKRGEERISIGHETRLLHKDNEAIDELFKEHPQGEHGIEILRHTGKDEIIYGGFSGKELVSLVRTYAKLPPRVALSSIFTKPEYRRRYFARSVISAMIAHLFSSGKFEEIQAYVRLSNTPAVNLFKRLGFTRYRDFLRIEKGQI